MIITKKDDLLIFRKLLDDGSSLEINIEYLIQNKPAGIPQVNLISEKFIENNRVTLILGDNIFMDMIYLLKKGLQ